MAEHAASGTRHPLLPFPSLLLLTAPPFSDFQKPQAAGSGQIAVGIVAQPRHPIQEESRHRPQWKSDNRRMAGVWADKALHCPQGPRDEAAA